TSSTSCSRGRFISSTSQRGPATRAITIEERTRKIVASVSQSTAGRNSRGPLSRSTTRSGPPWLPVDSDKNSEKRRAWPAGPVPSISARCLGMRRRSTARLIGRFAADLSARGYGRCVNVALALLLASLNAAAVQTRWIEGTLRGFPVVRQADGRRIGEGTLTQSIEDGKLHSLGIFDLHDGRRVREETVLDQEPRLRQRCWKWTETRGKDVLREFSVDLTTGHATAVKRSKDDVDTWDEHLDGTQDAFAGVGSMYALKNLSERLDRGEQIELTAVVFTSKP